VEDLYLVFKSLHVISIIAWMAGLLYLPRLFVYHCSAEVGSDRSETFKIMERRLLRAIMNPAMIASYIFGGLLIYELGADIWELGWVHIKTLGVVGLTLVHMRMAKWRKDFEADSNTRSEKFFRVMNEVPTILMIVIVFMVIMQPF
jgi:protoporphyrinogen IX oxidase